MPVPFTFDVLSHYHLNLNHQQVTNDLQLINQLVMAYLYICQELILIRNLNLKTIYIIYTFLHFAEPVAVVFTVVVALHYQLCNLKSPSVNTTVLFVPVFVYLQKEYPKSVPSVQMYQYKLQQHLKLHLLKLHQHIL